MFKKNNKILVYQIYIVGLFSLNRKFNYFEFNIWWWQYTRLSHLIKASTLKIIGQEKERGSSETVYYIALKNY